MQTQMIPVDSQMFSAIGFDPSNHEFVAQFKTGTLGAYGPATQEEFDEVLCAPSVGKAFNTLIKPTKRYRKVEAEEKQIPVEVQKRGLDDGPPNSIIDHNSLYPRTAKDQQAEFIAATAAPIDERIVIEQTTSIAEQALALNILTPDAHVLGQELIISIADMKKQVETFFAPMKTAAHAAHKAICTRENETLAPLIAAQSTLASRIKAFEKQVAADVAAEQERVRIAAAAEAERIAKEESERLAIEDAIALEAEGDFKGAEAVLANPTPVFTRPIAAPIVLNPLSRVTGAGKFLKPKKWRAVVTNPALVPREWLVVDQAALDKFADSRKELALVPGVRFEQAE